MRPEPAMRAARTTLLLLAVGCSGDFQSESGEATVADWGGPAGGYVELTPPDSPDSPGLLIEFEEDHWELRYGTGWSGAQQLGEPVSSVGADGYVLDDSVLVPAQLEVGSSSGGTTITSQGELEVWYGLFPEVIFVDVADGEFAGEAAFAPFVGPLRLTWQGQVWELVYYE